MNNELSQVIPEYVLSLARDTPSQFDNVWYEYKVTFCKQGDNCLIGDCALTAINEGKSKQDEVPADKNRGDDKD